jgi:hypothetical protein
MILDLKLHRVLLIILHPNLAKHLVLATADDLEWREDYNIAKDGNPSKNLAYLNKALYNT